MFLEENLLKLSAGLTLLLNEDDPEVSLESMFRLVEVLVTNHRRQATFDVFNNATIEYYSRKLDQLLQGSDEDLLYTLVSDWIECGKKVVIMRNIFLCYDRSIQNDLNFKTVSITCMNLFRSIIISHPAVSSKITAQLLGAVSKERAGFTVDKDLMVFITIILRDFGVYRGIFEEQLLIDEAIFKKRAPGQYGSPHLLVACAEANSSGRNSQLSPAGIDLQNCYNTAQCFQANPTFNDLIKNTFHKTINTESGQSALYLARYFDGKLRAKNITEENLEATFNKGMIMFRFLQSKDIFEAFYRKCLSKRLLFGRSTNQDIEHSIVLKMKRNAVKVLHRKSKECCAI
ncbi:hypothetical protein HUJ05_013361 [Dendroctonus ponderosae]|nr:hypothetical protein HUJ05_013361 [Dendroctonus ponderosae]